MRKFKVNDTDTARTVVTAAQILAMFGAPVTVINAPGKNKALVINRIHVQTAPGTAAFAGGGVVTFVYHGGAVNPHAGSIAAAAIISATSTNNLLAPIAAGIQIPANTGVDITNAAAAFTAGNGTLILTIEYSALTLG